MKTGLVLEGGAMRGLFSCGVIDVLLENHIPFDGGIGVSAGACFGCNYKSKQAGRALRYNKRFCNDPRYSSIRSLIFTKNLFNAKFCYHTLPEQLDILDFEMYKKNPMEFWAVASDLGSGKPVYEKLETLKYDELEFMRASASMPLVSEPVNYKGLKLLDGGMTDSIPLKFFQSIGYEKNVVILTQPADYVKKPNKLGGIMKLVYHKYPAIIDAMKRRHEVYNEETRYVFEQQKLGTTLVICPDSDLKISRTCKDPDELQRVYEIGRLKAKSMLEEIREFCRKHSAE